MITKAKQYPKLLAFLQLFYPTLYTELSRHSVKSDIVEANLICSNNIDSYQTIVFSEGTMKEGELFKVYAGKSPMVVYSWDWRWVFAVNILFKGEMVLPIKFQQKVIALPTGKLSLTQVFFKIVQDEFKEAVLKIVNDSTANTTSVHEAYQKYFTVK